MRPEDIWAGVAQHLEAARMSARRRLARPLTADDYQRMRDRFLVGHDRHGGDVLSWPRERFGDEAQQEADDLIIYRALELWKFGPGS
jgi:hypothetical protein